MIEVKVFPDPEPNPGQVPAPEVWRRYIRESATEYQADGVWVHSGLSRNKSIAEFQYLAVPEPIKAPETYVHALNVTLSGIALEGEDDPHKGHLFLGVAMTKTDLSPLEDEVVALVITDLFQNTMEDAWIEPLTKQYDAMRCLWYCVTDPGRDPASLEKIEMRKELLQ